MMSNSLLTLISIIAIAVVTIVMRRPPAPARCAFEAAP